MTYDDWKLMTPPDNGDEIDKECLTCEGLGKTEYSNCCGSYYDEDTGICLECKEHSDNICEECNGTGILDNSIIKNKLI
jgi:hypothetical protein